MNFEHSEADEAFRAEVRIFLEANLPAAIAKRHALGFHPLPKQDLLDWNRILADKGWAAPHWPVEFGGPGWTPMQRHIFEEECRRAHAPDLSWQGLRLCGPVIYTFGSVAQKLRFLPPILRGEVLMAQGFSEPNAGSDLASLKTSAVRDGEHYIVNGQKTWSSEGHYADWGFFLVRTDTTVKPQRGISFLMIDLNSPGVTVRPIVMFNGMHYVNEIFLDKVRVPADNLIGDEGAGWRYAKFLLDNERTSSAFIHFSREWLDRARVIAQRERVGKAPGEARLIDTPAFARRLAAVEIDLSALEYSVLRLLTEEKTRWDATAVASALKVRGSEIQQRSTELALDALGWRGLRAIDGFDDPVIGDLQASARWPGDVPGVASAMLQTRAVTIYGGAKEVQKNIIARLAFNL